MPAKGIQAVRRNYRLKVENIDGKTTGAAVFLVLREGAAIADTMVPVDTSNLINSRFAPQISHSKGKTTGKVGYSASYAAAVHGMSGKLKGKPRADFGTTSNHSKVGPQKPQAFGGGTKVGNYWDPSGEPQWLTKGFDRLKPAIPALLKKVYGDAK